MAVSAACNMLTLARNIVASRVLFLSFLHLTPPLTNTCFYIIPDGLMRQDHPPAVKRNRQFEMLPMVGKFEHYMVSYASIPSVSSPLVAVEMLAFRLRGGGSGRSRTSKGFSQHPSSGSSGMYAPQLPVLQTNRDLMQLGFLLLRWNRRHAIKDTSCECAAIRRHVRRTLSPTVYTIVPPSTSTLYLLLDLSPIAGSHLTIIASLHANGMIHLHDMTGENILKYDSGHGPATSVSGGATLTTIDASPTGAAAAGATRETAQRSPIVVGFSGDASENDPVLVTTGADGTVRVHTLTVNLRGKRITGRNRNSRRKAPQAEGSGAEVAGMGASTTATTSDGVDGGGTKDGPSRDSSEDGGGTGERGKKSESASPRAPPKTGTGVRVTVEFRVCLGAACSDVVGASASNERASTGTVEDGLEESRGRESSSQGGMAKAVTSVTAFYHRA